MTAKAELPTASEHARVELREVLQATLVELISLSLVGKQLHWNVAGPGFRELHRQLDELVVACRDLLDIVAERSRDRHLARWSRRSRRCKRSRPGRSRAGRRG
jgi:DNA-binding ferritin-like protein